MALNSKLFGNKNCMILIHIKMYHLIHLTLQLFPRSLECTLLSSGLIYALEQAYNVFSHYKIFVSPWKLKDLTSPINKIKVLRTLQVFVSSYSQHPTRKIRNCRCSILYVRKKIEARNS